MRPNQSVDAFIKFSLVSGVTIHESRPPDGLKQMFAFYENIRAVGCDGVRGDMLLFQWGTYDWGHGQFFELGITRQFKEIEFKDDDAISQLSLTFKYYPVANLTKISAGSRWLDARDKLKEFHDFVLLSEPVLFTSEITPEKIELRHEYV